MARPPQPPRSDDPSRRRQRRGPLILDLEDGDLPPAPEPSDAPPVLEPGEGGEGTAAARALGRAARDGPGGWSALFWGGLGAALTLAIGLAVSDFVAALFARADWLGWAGVAALGAMALAIAVWVVREAAALARLGRIDRVRRLSETAAATEAPGPARALAGELARFYAARPELGARELVSHAAEIADGPDIVDLAERRLMAPLDAAAERAVARAAQRVAAAAALVPLPALEVLLVLAINLRMIRQVGEVYGGRAGWLGAWRLLKAVAGHLAATGAISATDDMLGPLVGGGLLGQLSRRFGEAAVNAALTARVGTAAIEVCRPMPFRVRPAPKGRGIVLGALKGWQRPEAGPGR